MRNLAISVWPPSAASVAVKNLDTLGHMQYFSTIRNFTTFVSLDCSTVECICVHPNMMDYSHAPQLDTWLCVDDQTEQRSEEVFYLQWPPGVFGSYFRSDWIGMSNMSIQVTICDHTVKWCASLYVLKALAHKICQVSCWEETLQKTQRDEWTGLWTKSTLSYENIFPQTW